MEAEVVRCVATMFHGDQDVCGTVNRLDHFEILKERFSLFR